MSAFKRGARVLVRSGNAYELATVSVWRAHMLPQSPADPDARAMGYVPVRFDVDGARLLVHESQISLA